MGQIDPTMLQEDWTGRLSHGCLFIGTAWVCSHPEGSLGVMVDGANIYFSSQKVCVSCRVWISILLTSESRAEWSWPGTFQSRCQYLCHKRTLASANCAVLCKLVFWLGPEKGWVAHCIVFSDNQVNWLGGQSYLGQSILLCRVPINGAAGASFLISVVSGWPLCLQR